MSLLARCGKSRKRVSQILLRLPLAEAMARTFAPLQSDLDCYTRTNDYHTAKTRIYLQDYVSKCRYIVAEVSENEVLETVRRLSEELGQIKAVIVAGSKAA